MKSAELHCDATEHQDMGGTMKAKRINQPGLKHAIALYDARHFHSVLIDEDEARELIEELKRLLANTMGAAPGYRR